MNENIEKSVVNYILEIWYLESDSEQYIRTSAQFWTYMHALKDAEVITGDNWYERDFLEIIEKDMITKDIPGAVQHILDHLRSIAK